MVGIFFFFIGIHFRLLTLLASPVLPVIKGSCTEKSLVFEVTRGNMDHLWAMYIEKHQLTSELAAQRGYILTNQTKFILEVPLFSIGCIYEVHISGGH